jgi:hypothetical protein
MPIPRMTTRRVMVIVEWIALVLGCTIQLWRQRRATEYLGPAITQVGCTPQTLVVSADHLYAGEPLLLVGTPKQWE